jgi:hypothetical protein
MAESRFEALDPKLNVFALANGMDLNKGADFRRLEWFTEGLERGILIEPAGAGVFTVSVVSWRTGSSEIGKRASVGGGLSAPDVVGVLTPAIEAANKLT